MKNIIKIATSALIVFLTLGNVAFAVPATNGGSAGSTPSTNGGSTGSTNSTPSSNGGSTGSSNSIPSTNGGSKGSTNSIPSTNGGSIGSTNGTTPSNGGNGGSNGGGSKSSHRGGGYARTVSLTNVKIAVSGDKATVTWDTTPASTGMVIYGPLSLATPTTATSFYGYAAGTEISGVTMTHSHTFTMAPGITYYVRPVAFVGARAVFGSELTFSRTGSTVKTNAPAIGTMFDTPTKSVIDSKIPSDVEVSKATTTSNVAAAVKSHSKIGSFFKKIWASIIAPFCK